MTYPLNGINFLVSVIQLAKSFFEDHARQIKSGSFLLNTCDAEWIKMEAFFSTDYTSSKTKYTAEEIGIIKKNSNFENWGHDGFPTARLHIVNPMTVLSSLHVKEFTLDELSRIHNIMEATGKQLRVLWNAWRRRSTEFDLGESLTVNLSNKF